MNNLIPQFMSKVSGLFRQAYLQFDHLSSNMSPAHFAIVAVLIIGLGVILMRGKPVHGS